MWQYNYSSELYHHGILGMKWGVRRYQNKDGSLTEAGRRRKSKQKWKQKEKQIKKNRAKAVKNRHQLSDKELDRRINRLRKEQQLKQLDERVMHNGRYKTKKTVAAIGMGVASGVATKAVMAVIKNKLG